MTTPHRAIGGQYRKDKNKSRTCFLNRGGNFASSRLCGGYPGSLKTRPGTVMIACLAGACLGAATYDGLSAVQERSIRARSHLDHDAGLRRHMPNVGRKRARSTGN